MSPAASGSKRADDLQRPKRKAQNGREEGLPIHSKAVKQRKDSSPASSGEESLPEIEDELVDCDLEFYDPKPEDATGLRDLLQSLADGRSLDLDGLVEVVISQRRVGTVVKTAEDEDPLGFITVLNLQTHKQLPALQQIRRFLADSSPDSPSQRRLEQALFDEIKWATEDEPDEAARQSFQIEQFILLSRAFISAVELPQQQSSKKTKKHKKAQTTLSTANLIFMRPEDEFYHKHCSWSFAFPVANRPAGYEDTEQVRLCMLLTLAQIASARAELDTVVGNLAAGV